MRPQPERGPRGMTASVAIGELAASAKARARGWLAGLPIGRPGPWPGAPRSTRSRILASYVVLLALSALLSTIVIRQFHTIRLEQDVRNALRQESRELDRLLTDGRNPENGRPFVSLGAAFDVYLDRNVPSTNEAFLAYIDGRLYIDNLSQFPTETLPADILAAWSAYSSVGSGEGGDISGSFATQHGVAYYRANRIAFNGSDRGAFVVTILPADEAREIADLQVVGFIVTLGVLLAATLIAWLLAGRVLAPVQQLTETARSISQSDLTQRIEVRGSDEAAEMARSFNAMLDRLEAVFRSQREFVQDASHELRDPLTICRGQLELLSDDPEERLAAVAIALDELDRMARIVDDLQLLAEAEQRDFLRLDRLQTGPFAHELLAKARTLAIRHWELEAHDDGVVVADRHRLTEAVMNLAHNAVQHTDSDDRISIGISLDDAAARLSVADTGMGVALSDQDRIFERFTRGRGADRRYRGGGLGLAIVKAIAEAHTGRVELDSRLGHGATFTIVIPREPSPGGDSWPAS